MVSGPTDNPPTKRKGGKDTVSDASDYNSPEGTDNETSASGSEGEPEDDDFMMSIDKKKGKGKKRANLADPVDSAETHGVNEVNERDIEPEEEDIIACGLCGSRHGVKQCPMTDSSQNLAEYREMLILHADDEPWEERVRHMPPLL